MNEGTTRVAPTVGASEERDIREASSRVRLPTIDAVWAVLAVALPVALAFISRTQAVDLAYQIRAGEWMLDTRSVLRVDGFTFTVPGEPWLNQQWGAQVMLAAAYRIGSWTAIALLRALLLAASLTFLYRSCRAVGASARTSSLLTLAGWFVTIEILSMLRPQQFGFVLFAASVWIVATRHEHPHRLWWIPPLVALWANIHGSFPLVLVLLAFAWWDDGRHEQGDRRRIALVALLAALATLLNPYGLEVWRYVMELSTHPVVARRVAEWGPPSIHSPVGLLFFLSLGGVIVFLARSGSLRWRHLVEILLFAALAVLAIRGVVWWGLMIPVIVASLVPSGRRSSPRSFVNAAVIATLVGATVLLSGARSGTDPVSGAPTLLSFAPERLVAAARAEVPAGNAFVSQLYASWSEFSAPGLLVAVDSRIEIYPEEIWDLYFAVSAGREDWRSIVDAWGVDVLVLHPEQAKGLLAVLPTDAGWRLVMEDSSGAVYVRA